MYIITTSYSLLAVKNSSFHSRPTPPPLPTPTDPSPLPHPSIFLPSEIVLCSSSVLFPYPSLPSVPPSLSFLLFPRFITIPAAPGYKSFELPSLLIFAGGKHFPLLSSFLCNSTRFCSSTCSAPRPLVHLPFTTSAPVARTSCSSPPPPPPHPSPCLPSTYDPSPAQPSVPAQFR